MFLFLAERMRLSLSPHPQNSVITLASIRLPVGNAAMLEGEPLPSISKAGGEIARQGSQLFRIQSERDIWVLYVWQGWLGKKQKTRLKRFKSYDKAMSYVAEYV